MAKINDLVELLVQIKGVDNYILVRDDGHMLTNNFDDPDSISSIVLFNGLNGEIIKPLMGLSYFKYLCYKLEDDAKLLIFPMSRYFLGILHKNDAYTPDVVEALEKIVETLSRKK